MTAVKEAAHVEFYLEDCPIFTVDRAVVVQKLGLPITYFMAVIAIEYEGAATGGIGSRRVITPTSRSIDFYRINDNWMPFAHCAMCGEPDFNRPKITAASSAAETAWICGNRCEACLSERCDSVSHNLRSLCFAYES